MKKINLLLLMTTIFALSSCESTSVESKTETEETKNTTTEITENIEEQKAELEKAEKSAKENEKKSADNAFIESISTVNIKIVNAPREATKGNEFVRPFTIAVKDTAGETAVPLADFPITIRYPSSKTDGKLVYTTENVKTDAEGMFVFTAPRTSFSAAGDFFVYPTYTVTDENGNYIEPADEVKEAIAMKTAATPWLVKSDLAYKGGILVVWEFNERDRFQGNCSDLISELRSRNVKNVTNAPYCDSSYIGQPVEKVLKDNLDLLNDMELSYGYMIYGTVKFSKDVTPNEDGSYSCALIADIQSISMKDGSVVLHKTYEQEATGKGWNDVVGKCKNKLISKIVDSLLYEM